MNDELQDRLRIIGRGLADPGSATAAVRDFASFGAIIGVRNAEKTLMAGFTQLDAASHFNLR